MKYKLTSLAILAAALLLEGCRDECVTGPLSTHGLSQQEADFLKVVWPWTQQSKTCRVSGYLLVVPANGGPDGILVAPDGTKVMFMGPGNWAVQAKDGSLTTLQDLTGGGRFDSISYSAIDPADGQKFSVTDANADGVLDLKIGDHGGFVNISGQWCRLEKRGDQVGAIVGGEWKPLQKEGRVYRLMRE